MKIIWITSLFPSGNDTTKGVYLYRTVKKLSSYYDITTIVIYPAIPPIIQMLEKPKEALKTYNYWKKNFPKNPTPPVGIDPSKIYYVRYWRLPRRFFNHLEGYFAYFKAKKIFNKIITKETLIHSNWIFPSGQLAFILNKRYNIPYIVSLLGTDVHNLIYGTNYWKKAKKIITNASIISSVSPQLVEKCKREKIDIANDKLFYIDNIYEEEKFLIQSKSKIKEKLKFSNKSKIIFFAGGLVPIKNVQILIKAFSWIYSKNKNVKLLIAGAGIDRKKLEQLAIELSCIKNIDFLGNLTSDDLVDYYNASDVFCLPSKNEGTPNVIIEALLCGVPVVASAVGGIPNIIQEGSNGYLFESDNESELKEKLAKALEHNWDREKLRESVAPFFSSNVLKKYKQMYSTVV